MKTISSLGNQNYCAKPDDTKNRWHIGGAMQRLPFCLQLSMQSKAIIPKQLMFLNKLIMCWQEPSSGDYRQSYSSTLQVVLSFVLFSYCINLNYVFMCFILIYAVLHANVRLQCDDFTAWDNNNNKKRKKLWQKNQLFGIHMPTRRVLPRFWPRSKSDV